LTILKIHLSPQKVIKFGKIKKLIFFPVAGKPGKDKKKIPKTFGERVSKKVKPSPAVEIEYEYNEGEQATEDA